MNYTINMQRIYQPISNEDGFRFLADRLWPRGIKRDALNLDLWLPKIAPSNQLRKSWHNKELSFDEFTEAYQQELAELEGDLLPLMIAARKGQLTLLSSVKNIEVSHVPILRDKIFELLRREDRLDQNNEQTSSPCYLKEFKDW